MEALLGIAGLLLVAVITPGPNNLIVMAEAARGGWPAAGRAAIGILAGTVALLALGNAGVGAALPSRPGLSLAIAVAGGLYLTFLGARLIAAGSRAERVGEEPVALASGAAGLFAFQFLNPKAWVTTLTAVAAAQTTVGAAALPVLSATLLAVSVPSLALWSSCGVALTRRLERPLFRAWFNRAAGGLLVASAALLVAGVYRTVGS